MTSNKEDYLKAIYEEGGLEHYVPNKLIAERLKVAAPSVSEMLSKLQQSGLIEYRAYHGSKLTESGMAACLHVVRSHRLWEVFLMRHLGYTWREAHEDAHLLEHIAPERMIDRLDCFLNFPETCPHGAKIPPKGTDPSSAESLLPLNSLAPGEKAQLARIEEDGELLDYLAAQGLQVGKEIQMLSAAEYEGPVTFQQEEKTITISCKAAAQVYVKRHTLNK